MSLRPSGGPTGAAARAAAPLALSDRAKAVLVLGALQKSIEEEAETGVKSKSKEQKKDSMGIRGIRKPEAIQTTPFTLGEYDTYFRYMTVKVNGVEGFQQLYDWWSAGLPRTWGLTLDLVSYPESEAAYKISTFMSSNFITPKMFDGELESLPQWFYQQNHGMGERGKNYMFFETDSSKYDKNDVYSRGGGSRTVKLPQGEFVSGIVEPLDAFPSPECLEGEVGKKMSEMYLAKYGRNMECTYNMRHILEIPNVQRYEKNAKSTRKAFEVLTTITYRFTLGPGEVNNVSFRFLKMDIKKI